MHENIPLPIDPPAGTSERAQCRVGWLRRVNDRAHRPGKSGTTGLPSAGPSSHPIECRSACHRHLYTGHGAIAHAKCLGHLLYSITPRQPSAYDGFDLGASPWAPEAHSTGFGTFQARLHATADHSPLELGKCAGHLEELVRPGQTSTRYVHVRKANPKDNPRFIHA